MAMWGVFHGCTENAIDTSVPLGGIIPYDTSYSGSPGTLPEGWAWCDGGLISDSLSPFFGENTLNLNGTDDNSKRFLIGSTSGEQTGLVVGSATHNHTPPTQSDLDVDDNDRVRTTSLNSASSIPKYYEIQYIMRVR